MMARPRESWSLRRETNLVYVVFPSAMLLVQEDHAVRVQALPLATETMVEPVVELVGGIAVRHDATTGDRLCVIPAGDVNTPAAA